MLSDDSHGKMEQIALESGFSSGSAFSQVFKKIKGVTPREYIENKKSFSE
jgi:transcriptional regulator GlxA family with amidase domain